MVGINSFISVLKREEPERIPVWFMRQAGRYLPEYQKVRAGKSLQDICRDARTTIEVTRQPLGILGVDAAILFSDIMLPLESMGFRVSFKEGYGPVIENSIVTKPDMADIHNFDSSELGYPVDKSIREFKEQNSATPLIGFTGGPMTLLSYVTNGGSDRDLQATRKLIQTKRGTYSEAMNEICDMVASYAKYQAKAGADAIQIFDSWAGALSAYAFRDYARNCLQPVFEDIKSTGVPLIYFGTGLSGHLEELRNLNFDVLSMDWRMKLSSAHRATGGRFIMQGNLDPLIAASPSYLNETRRILEDFGSNPDFIFNLGHGVLPHTPPENLRSIVNYVHAFR